MILKVGEMICSVNLKKKQKHVILSIKNLFFIYTRYLVADKYPAEVTQTGDYRSCFANLIVIVQFSVIITFMITCITAAI